MKTPSGDTITVLTYALLSQIKKPCLRKNSYVGTLICGGFMRNHLNGEGVEIIDISPMGCRTGFYMSLIGQPDEQRVANAWKAAMEDVLKVKDQNHIPELNVYQCGTYEMHSLAEAQDIARDILSHTIGINHNDELALPEDKLKELQI